MKKFFGPEIIICFLLTSPVWGGTSLIRFQGRLTDSQGRPVTGQPYVKFQIYDSLKGPGMKWEAEDYQAVQSNESGLFSTEIGPIPEELFSQLDEMYLQVIIKGGTGRADQFLAPRQKFSSVPTALYSKFAGGVVGSEIIGSTEIKNGSIETEDLKDQSVNFSKIADHSVDIVKLSPRVVSMLDLPTGVIIMSTTTCPDGWTRFQQWDGDNITPFTGFSISPGVQNAYMFISPDRPDLEAAQSYTIPASGVLLSLKMYPFKMTDGSWCFVSVYADNNGKPGSRLYRSEQKAIDVEGINEISVYPNLYVGVGQKVWFAIESGGSSIMSLPGPLEKLPEETLLYRNKTGWSRELFSAPETLTGIWTNIPFSFTFAPSASWQPAKVGVVFCQKD